MRPGQEQRCDHLDDAGDACTMVGLTASAAAELWGDAELERVDRRRVASGRPATERARRALADGARTMLADDPRASLGRLARALAASPHHLSRVFSAQTGTTISAYRRRLRVRAVLDRLEHGEPDLARLAADLGFADHAHLTRTVRDELGATPSRLRELLAVPGVVTGATPQRSPAASS